MRHEKSEQILFRNRRLDKIGHAFPVTVVEDDEDLRALYLAAETPVKQRVMPDVSPFSREAPHRTGDGKWVENSVLMLTKFGESRSFRALWRDSDREFLGRHINLQAPLQRTTLGFEDHVLDVNVDTDGSWEWKDEFSEAQRLGRFTEEEAEEILEEAKRAEARIKSHSWPLGSDWEEWRPEKGWSLPEIPKNWDET